MEIFNIGPLELIGILLIMFFLLGPKGMILTAQKIGAWIRKMVKSPVWKEIMGYSQDIRELPKKIMDDTGLKEALDDVQKTTKETAAELNSTVNEAVQSARVPEAEHVRIDTTPAAGADNRKTYPVAEPGKEQTIAPPAVAAKAVVVSESSSESTSAKASEAATEISLDSEADAPVEQEAGTESSADKSAPAAVEKKPRRRAKVQEPTEKAAADLPASEEKSTAPKRARSRKAAEVVELAPVEAKAVIEVEPVAQMDAISEQSQALEAVVSAEAADTAETAQAATPNRKPRKSRKEIPAVVDTVTLEETRVGVDSLISEASQADLQPTAPAPSRKTRARKDNGTSAVSVPPVEQSPATAQGPVDDTPESPLPAANEPLVLAEQQLPQGTPTVSTEDPLPVRKPRRPRTVKQAPENPTTE